MSRRLFTLASAVSLVLCLVMAVVWVRSYWQSDLVVFPINCMDEGAVHSVGAQSLHGGVSFFLDRPRLSQAHGNGYRMGLAESADRVAVWRSHYLEPANRELLREFRGYGLSGFYVTRYIDDRWEVWPGSAGRVMRREWHVSVHIPHWVFVFAFAGVPFCYAAGVVRARLRQQRLQCSV